MEMPDVKMMRNVVDKMKSLDKMLHIRADMGAGSIIVGAASETVAIKTYFRDLTPQAGTPRCARWWLAALN